MRQPFSHGGNMNSKPRVVVTGIGIVSSIGIGKNHSGTHL